MKRGVYILAFGDATYAHWAVNLAASIKFYSPSVSVTLIHDEVTIKHVLSQELQVFSNTVLIKPEHIYHNGKFSPGWAKLNMYEYFEHEENILIDADSIGIRELKSLFDKCQEKTIASEVAWTGNESSGSWPCMWMHFSELRSNFELPEKFDLYEINSSFIYSKKNEAAEKFWSFAKGNFKADYNRNYWGRSMPDELAFNMAFAQTGINPSIGHVINATSKIGNQKLGLVKLAEHCWFLTFWGAKTAALSTHYEHYELQARMINRVIFGRHNPYKPHLLMKKKYVAVNRSMPVKPHKEVPKQSFKKGVTVVITSCGRFDLLRETLISFKKFNTYPVEKIIIVEDSGQVITNDIQNEFPEVSFIVNEIRIGQIKSIDKAYEQVETEYVFHCEDDWTFTQGGFIEKSIQVLQSDKTILQVWIRALDDLNGHPVEGKRELSGNYIYDVKRNHKGIFHGFSFNPGLRRLADYKRIGSYSRHTVFDRKNPGKSEIMIGKVYHSMGYRAVVLPGYVKHIGEGRHVA